MEDKNKFLDRLEIAFFDVETTRPGQEIAILEFGAILVCPQRLEEKGSYSTLVRPGNPNIISTLAVRRNGITPEAVLSAPSFSDIADTVYGILHGRIWAGHNIERFDCARIREAFTEIGRQPPEAKGIIDSFPLLTERFGRRAGDMKMASLATYFGLGKQTHRSLNDARLNLEILKYCSTVLFFESSLPEAFLEESWVLPNATTRSRGNGKMSLEGTDLNLDLPSSSSKPVNIPVLSPMDHTTDGNHPNFSLVTGRIIEDPFDMGSLGNEMTTDSLRPDVSMQEKVVTDIAKIPSTATVPEGCGGSAEFLEPDEVSVASISASHVTYFRGSKRIVILHKGVALQLHCPCLRVWFGLSTKFLDDAGRPRLSFVVNASPALFGVLDACDEAAQKCFVDSGSCSDWRHVVSRKEGYANYPTVRLHIPTVVNANSAQSATEIYQKEPTGSMQKLFFSEFDATELNSVITRGIFVDVSFSLDPYDYQRNAGIRLVAKKIVIHDK